ncbi:hypothetical protein CEXT_159841 [Caerostris extrusa]|uniref:Uncharacterized protein n=1 Tax=Caerostris extrusa TaxID=172846 RepID=A0AAV4TRJ5_CAEEX|nr:hypothetical protein CEXT_159841 [Caerostris extrusa]
MEEGGGGGCSKQKTARDKNTVSEFVLKSQNLPLIPVIPFLHLFISLFPMGSSTTSLAFYQDVPRDGEIVIGRVLYPLPAGEGGLLQNGKRTKEGLEKKI